MLSGMRVWWCVCYVHERGTIATLALLHHFIIRVIIILRVKFLAQKVKTHTHMRSLKPFALSSSCLEVEDALKLVLQGAKVCLPASFPREKECLKELLLQGINFTRRRFYRRGLNRGRLLVSWDEWLSRVLNC